MPTLYTHALLFDATGDSGTAAANAAYNDLGTATVVVLLQFSGGASGYLWSKGNNTNALAAELSNSGLTDLTVQRAVTASRFRNFGTIATDNSWRWVAFGLNRTAGTNTRMRGPFGGTMETVTANDISSGSGAWNSDAAFDWRLGFNGVNSAARNMGIAGFGIFPGVLTLAQFQEVADDLDTASVQPIAFWQPDAGTTTSIPCSDPLLPSMTLTGTTVVDGPDDAPAAGNFAQYYTTQLRAAGLI
jgi:hypothetical protein